MGSTSLRDTSNMRGKMDSLEVSVPLFRRVTVVQESIRQMAEELMLHKKEVAVLR